MKKYIVSIEREAQQICVGEIMGDSSETASFCYSETYLNSPLYVAGGQSNG